MCIIMNVTYWHFARRDIQFMICQLDASLRVKNDMRTLFTFQNLFREEIQDERRIRWSVSSFESTTEWIVIMEELFYCDI